MQIYYFSPSGELKVITYSHFKGRQLIVIFLSSLITIFPTFEGFIFSQVMNYYQHVIHEYPGNRGFIKNFYNWKKNVFIIGQVSLTALAWLGLMPLKLECESFKFI